MIPGSAIPFFIFIGVGGIATVILTVKLDNIMQMDGRDIILRIYTMAMGVAALALIVVSVAMITQYMQQS